MIIKPTQGHAGIMFWIKILLEKNVGGMYGVVAKGPEKRITKNLDVLNWIQIADDVMNAADLLWASPHYDMPSSMLDLFAYIMATQDSLLLPPTVVTAVWFI